MTDQITETPAEQSAPEGATSQSVEEVVDQLPTQPQVSPESDTGKNEEGELPKDNAAWAAMRTENKRLKETLETVDPSYLESLRSATRTQEYPRQQIPKISDDAEYKQVTESVNWGNEQAIRNAQELASLKNQLEIQQDKEAERAFPQLKTDKVFEQIVSEKKLAARILGHQRTTLEIAEEVARLFNKRDEEVVAKTTEQTKTRMIERQAISNEPRGQTTSGRDTTTNEERRMRVRKGDSAAQTEVAKDIIADLEF